MKDPIAPRLWLSIGCLIIPLALAADEQPASRPRPETMAHACAGCHGTFGKSEGKTPKLAGMKEAIFIQSMRDFKSGKRTSSIMNRIAKGFRDEDFVAMARIFSRY